MSAEESVEQTADKIIENHTNLEGVIIPEELTDLLESISQALTNERKKREEWCQRWQRGVDKGTELEIKVKDLKRCLAVAKAEHEEWLRQNVNDPYFQLQEENKKLEAEIERMTIGVERVFIYESSELEAEMLNDQYQQIRKLQAKLERARKSLEVLGCIVAVTDGPMPTKMELDGAWGLIHETIIDLEGGGKP